MTTLDVALEPWWITCVCQWKEDPGPQAAQLRSRFFFFMPLHNHARPLYLPQSLQLSISGSRTTSNDHPANFSGTLPKSIVPFLMPFATKSYRQSPHMSTRLERGGTACRRDYRGVRKNRTGGTNRATTAAESD
jgi:hypothetical protein